MPVPEPISEIIPALKALAGDSARAAISLGESAATVRAKLFSDAHSAPAIVKANSIPLFNSDGLLPLGIHEATLPEVTERLGFSDHRQLLLEGLSYGVQSLKQADAPHVFLGGSFVRNTIPRDLDVSYPNKLVNHETLKRVEPMIGNGSWYAQKMKYGAEFRPDFETFFSQTRMGKPMGIVKLDLESVPRTTESIDERWFESRLNAPVADAEQRASSLAMRGDNKKASEAYSEWLRLSEERLALRQPGSNMTKSELTESTTLLERYRTVQKFHQQTEHDAPADLGTRIDKLESALRREIVRLRFGAME